MITGKVQGYEEQADRIRRGAAYLHGEVKAAVTEAAIYLDAYIVRDELSGQILHRRSGRLSGSIHHAILDLTNAIYAFVGTNVKYGGYHEYGYKGTVNVKAHMRRTRAEQFLFTRGARKGEINEARTKRVQKAKAATVQVKAHTREVDYGGNPFLRPALKEKQDFISESIQARAFKAVRAIRGLV